MSTSTTSCHDRDTNTVTQADLQVSIQQVLATMAIKQGTATFNMNKILESQGPCATVAYYRGKQDALKEVSTWLREYTGWAETLATLKKERS